MPENYRVPARAARASSFHVVTASATGAGVTEQDILPQFGRVFGVQTTIHIF
jgi:hypothetical protein